MTLKQRGVDFFFQRTDLATDGGLAEGQHLPGMSKTSCGRHCVKNA
jgi:hypothetical protein